EPVRGDLPAPCHARSQRGASDHRRDCHQPARRRAVRSPVLEERRQRQLGRVRDRVCPGHGRGQDRALSERDLRRRRSRGGRDPFRRRAAHRTARRLAGAGLRAADRARRDGGRAGHPQAVRPQGEAQDRGPRPARSDRGACRVGVVRRARLLEYRPQAEDAGEPGRAGSQAVGAMSLSGNIEDVSVADALQFIHLGGRTGTLTLTCGEAKAGIGFHQGRIVNAWAPGGKRLGELLIEAGILQQATLDEALRRQESEHPRRSIGQILVAMNAVDSETIYRTVEQQIERTVYDLVTWNEGTFHFALDDLKPLDDIAVIPGDVIRHLNLDTQMVLLDALRIFDERNRGRGPHNGGPAADHARPAPPATPGAPARSAPTPPVGVTLLPDEGRTRLQVVSGDREIADRLAQALPEVTVARVNLRDAGTPPPGEPPPLVLIDMREGRVALDSVSALRRARPR